MGSSADLKHNKGLESEDHTDTDCRGLPCLHLIISTIFLPALSTLEEVGLGALYCGQPAVIDAFFDELFPLLLNLVAGHLLAAHSGKPLCGDHAQQKV